MVSKFNNFTKGAVGRVNGLPNTQVCIINDTVHVSGETVMLGYYGIDENPFIEHDNKKWFKTQDIGVIDDEGNLFITGRKSNLIILDDGNNISPDELEELFEPYELIKGVLVHEGENVGGKVVAAIIYPDPEQVADNDEATIKNLVQEIVDSVNEKLPSYKKIKQFKIRNNDFKRTSLNKIIRSGVNL